MAKPSRMLLLLLLLLLLAPSVVPGEVQQRGLRPTQGVHYIIQDTDQTGTPNGSTRKTGHRLCQLDTQLQAQQGVTKKL